MIYVALLNYCTNTAVMQMLMDGGLKESDLFYTDKVVLFSVQVITSSGPKYNRILDTSMIFWSVRSQICVRKSKIEQDIVDPVFLS